MGLNMPESVKLRESCLSRKRRTQLYHDLENLTQISFLQKEGGGLQISQLIDEKINCRFHVIRLQYQDDQGWFQQCYLNFTLTLSILSYHLPLILLNILVFAVVPKMLSKPWCDVFPYHHFPPEHTPDICVPSCLLLFYPL